MLLAPFALALSLVAQAPPAIGPANPTVPIAALAPLPINSTVDLKPPGLGTVDVATMHELLHLVQRPDLSEQQMRAAYEKVKGSGRVVEFTGPTRMVLHAVTPDDEFQDNRTGRPALIYSGSLLDGPGASRVIFVLPD